MYSVLRRYPCCTILPFVVSLRPTQSTCLAHPFPAFSSSASSNATWPPLSPPQHQQQHHSCPLGCPQPAPWFHSRASVLCEPLSVCDSQGRLPCRPRRHRPCSSRLRRAGPRPRRGRPSTVVSRLAR